MLNIILAWVCNRLEYLFISIGSSYSDIHIPYPRVRDDIPFELREGMAKGNDRCRMDEKGCEGSRICTLVISNHVSTCRIKHIDRK